MATGHQAKIQHQGNLPTQTDRLVGANPFDDLTGLARNTADVHPWNPRFALVDFHGVAHGFPAGSMKVIS
jgi:hypothetical protein